MQQPRHGGAQRQEKQQVARRLPVEVEPIRRVDRGDREEQDRRRRDAGDQPAHAIVWPAAQADVKLANQRDPDPRQQPERLPDDAAAQPVEVQPLVRRTAVALPEERDPFVLRIPDEYGHRGHCHQRDGQVGAGVLEPVPLVLASNDISQRAHEQKDRVVFAKHREPGADADAQPEGRGVARLVAREQCGQPVKGQQPEENQRAVGLQKAGGGERKDRREVEDHDREQAGLRVEELAPQKVEQP